MRPVSLIFFLFYFLLHRDNSDSDDEVEASEQDYASLDSVPSDNSLPGGTFSPRNSEPPSLTESMHMMDEILSNKTMDRFSKIDKLEAILSAATFLPNEQVRKWFCFFDFDLFHFCFVSFHSH